MQMGEDFISLFNEVVRIRHESIQLALSTTFSHRSPDSALSNIRERDINIILGFFGPETARYTLCRVSCFVITINSMQLWTQNPLAHS